MERSPLALATVAVPAIALFCSGCGTCAPRSVCVGLDEVFYVVRGQGEPTLVLESGIGNGYSSWSPVLDDLASLTRTFAYSRPGYAADYSSHREQAMGRRTSQDVALLLHEILRVADLPPPYVLVGHGAGGTYLLRFAALHPEEVAGIVLLNADLRGFREECREAGLELCRPPGPWPGRTAYHVRAELRGLPGSEAMMPTAAELGDIPVTVIAGTKPPRRASAERQELWLEFQARYAADAADGCFVVAEDSGYFVQRDDPGLVIEEVRRILERVRARSVASAS